MSGIKKYDIDGVADTLQLGKQGPHLVGTNDQVELRDQNGVFTIGRAAPGSGPNDLVVMSQYTSQESAITAQGTAITALQASVATLTATDPVSSLTITPQASGTEVLGNLLVGSAVTSIAVEVTTAFDGNLEVSVGNKAVVDFYMETAHVDLQNAATYVVTPQGTPTESDVVVTFSGTSTVGAATMKLTYS